MCASGHIPRLQPRGRRVNASYDLISAILQIHTPSLELEEVGYCWPWIIRFTHIVKLLYASIQASLPLRWAETEQKVFKALKIAVMLAMAL